MAKKLPRNLNYEKPLFTVSPRLYPWACREDHSLIDGDRDVQVYFRELEAHLVHHIESAPLVLGCVAWLTSEPVLSALARRPKGCAFIVQKEDFLRPDVGQGARFKGRLRRLYDSLPARLMPEDFQPVLCDVAHNSFGFGAAGCVIEPVRCVGQYNRAKTAAAPRMHNKFAIFCDFCDGSHFFDETIRPYAVWTGSFNFTKNAVLSLENAVLIRTPEVVDAYYLEWQHIAMLSEPLDWETDWVEPEWRIGT